MKKTYLTPSLEMVELEIETTILVISGDSATSNSIPSFGPEESAW